MFKREVDTSVQLINNIGITTMSKECKTKEKAVSLGEELTSVVKYLSAIARSENIEIHKLWLEKIPAKIYVDSLKSKYNYNKQNFIINPVIGEYDDPDNQKQYVLTLPFSNLGNALVYGITGSGKEEFLSTLLYSCMTTYTVTELNFYLLDLGSEALRIFETSPMVGDIAYLNDTDKINNLFKMLQEELVNRKNLFSSFGGSFLNYLSSSGKMLPNIVIVLNNYEAFLEAYEDLNEELGTITREATRYGIYFILIANSESNIRLRIKQNFALCYALQLNNESDYLGIFGNTKGKVPAKIKGRGLFKKDKIYEFQTASICVEEENKYILSVCQKLKENITGKAKKIPILPDVVDFNSIKDALSTTTDIVVGIDKESLLVEKYNLTKNSIHLICSYDMENMDSYIHAFVNQLIYQNFAHLLFFNTVEHTFQNENLNALSITKNIEEYFLEICNYIDKVYEIYEKEKFNEEVLKKQKKMVCILYGIYNFMHKLSDEVKERIGDIIKKDAQMGLVTFVIIDSPDVIKQFSYEDWFKIGTDTSRGIWIGSGIADQSLLKISKITREDREEISNEYGYIVNNAKITKVKLLTSFEIPKGNKEE